MSNFFGGTFFQGGFFGEIGTAEVVIKTGTGGIDPKRKTLHKPIYKPTGLQRRKTLTLKKDPRVSERAEQSREIQAEVAEQLAREFGAETQAILGPPLEKMALVDIEREIGALLRRKIRSEEEEIMLLLLMAVSQ